MSEVQLTHIVLVFSTEDGMEDATPFEHRLGNERVRHVDNPDSGGKKA